MQSNTALIIAKVKRSWKAKEIILTKGISQIIITILKLRIWLLWEVLVQAAAVNVNPLSMRSILALGKN